MRSLRKPLLLDAGAAVLLAGVTWLDYVTGYELGFFVFYFLPVALVAWYGTRKGGIAVAVAAALCWHLADRLSLHPYSSASLIYWETFMRLVSFLAVAVTIARIRTDLGRREELLDVVSHDLRSPLAALQGQAQVLGRRAGGDAFVAARVESILRCATRMDATIEDLLDSARKESNQLDLRLEPVDLGAYLAELLDRYGTVLEPERIRLVRDGAAARAPVARADPRRLDRVVMNLLSNALKYSPAEAPVELEVSERGEWVSIRVADRGPGIPAADLPRVFDRFYRGKATAARGGLGIGLYSVRLLVEAHGGAVRVEPRPQGGTAFQVDLPAWRDRGGGDSAYP
jgi:signal transduction histidine kinase